MINRLILIAALASGPALAEDYSDHIAMADDAIEAFTPQQGECLMTDACALTFLRAFRAQIATRVVFATFEARTLDKGSAMRAMEHFRGQTSDAASKAIYSRALGILSSRSAE